MIVPAVQAGAPVRFGKYQLVERLGRGGMAEVWKALMMGPQGFTRTLVVKRILPHLVEDPHFVQMFVAEARLSARLNHANIVQVYELGDVGGEYYLAMEYVHGHDLVDIMRAQLLRGMPDPGLAAWAMRDICRALGYAHGLTDDRGVPLKLIHRDVSPSNVMLGFDGAVKLLDFGIAKVMAEANENKTQTGTLKGKFGYMSPEQVDGKPFDHRADLFAAGIVLHETLAGRRLFKGAGDLQTIAMVREAKVEAPSLLNPQVPPELDRVCLRALAKHEEDRYQTGDEMAADLEQVVRQLACGTDRMKALLRELFPEEPSNGSPRVIEAPPDTDVSVSLPGRLARFKRAAIAGGAALVLGTGLLLAARHHHRPPPKKDVIPSVPLTVEPPIVVAPVSRDPEPSAQVRVQVLSTPPEAQVFLDGERSPRGRTPLTLTLDRSKEPRRLILKAHGYHSDSLAVTPERDAVVQLNLVPLPAPAHHASKHRGSTPNLKRGDVVDPFAN